MKYTCTEKTSREINIPKHLEEKILEIWNNKDPENHKYYDILVYLLLDRDVDINFTDTKFIEHSLIV
jgi:hypothetical protein